MNGPGDGQSRGDASTVTIDWGVRIPMRDGLSLHAVLYRPKDEAGRLPGLLTITPYLTDSFHDAGVYFASNGFLFAAIDCRGRGNSDGEFVSYEMDGVDGHDAVEWLARHPLCNGQVAMGGGSYSGRNQWATMMQAPPHLTSIMPRCASYPGLDFPIRNNIGEQYTLQWLAFTAGRGLQTSLFRDHAYWSTLWRDRFVAGQSYASLAEDHPEVAAQFDVWMRHPEPDAYWDGLNPGPEHYAMFTRPSLTVTGYFDDDQQGALAYYQAAETYGSPTLRENNYLVIGPWDHTGVGAPSRWLDGVDFGEESVIDMRALSRDWYRWTMTGGARPPLLVDKVVYFVVGKGWQSAPSLDAISARHQHLYLESNGRSCFSAPGGLVAQHPTNESWDRYLYDPLVVDTADLEREILPYNLSDTRLLVANDGRQLVYDSQPFGSDLDISGLFRLDAWLGIDQPDTDIRVLIYAINVDGGASLLTHDAMRARYRESLREPRLIDSPDPRPYRFDKFWMTSRLMKAGERLRLVIGPFNSIYTQKNFNSGKAVAGECRDDARTVEVSLLAGGPHAAVLHMPVGA